MIAAVLTLTFQEWLAVLAVVLVVLRQVRRRG